MLKIHTFVTGPIQANTYLVYVAGDAAAVLIDPGDEASRLEKEIRALGLSVKLILATHGHFDHIGAVDALSRAFGAPLAMQSADNYLLDRQEDSAAFYGQQPSKRPTIERPLQGGETVAAEHENVP